MTAYTVASLAKEWHCSEGVIRKAIASGDLGCFRLGVLIRIPKEEVRRFECRNLPSNDCSEDMQSSGATQRESADATHPVGTGKYEQCRDCRQMFPTRIWP